MDGQKSHRAKSRDGTEVAGSVRGTGPPIVFVHGSLADGELEWSEVVAHLEARFTCHMMSTRGRGASQDVADHSSPRLVEDVVAYVDSVGDRPGLVGTSFGGRLAFGAAARGAPALAVAAYEPLAYEVMDEALWALWRARLERIRELAEDGRQEEAVRVFVDFVANPEEKEALADAGDFMEAMARYVPVDLVEFEAVSIEEDQNPTAASALARIGVPVLVMHGSRTALPWFTDSVCHMEAHVPDCLVRQIAGVGHLAPSTVPETLAGILEEFFEMHRAG